MNSRTRRERFIIRERRRGFQIDPPWSILDIISGGYSLYYLTRLVTDPVFAQEVKDRAQMISDIFKDKLP